MAARVADAVMARLTEAGCPPGLVGLVHGGDEAAQWLAGEPGIDAVTLTGSEAAGFALGEICLGRHKPF